MGEVILGAAGASYTYPAATSPALRDVDLEIVAGEMLTIVGPNGCGKTTLLRLLLGVVTASRGDVSMLGQPASSWSRREIARTVGVVTQTEVPTFPLRVRDAVTLGRYPHLGARAALSDADRSAIDDAMAKTDISHLARRWTHTLSGGEWQRVRIARALCQSPRLLVLDEPTANLDLRHEMEVFELAAELVVQDGLAALVVTHNVNLAARFANRVLVMKDGATRALGRPGAVLAPDLLAEVFGWPVEQIDWKGLPQFVPARRTQAGE